MDTSINYKIMSTFCYIPRIMQFRIPRNAAHALYCTMYEYEVSLGPYIHGLGRNLTNSIGADAVYTFKVSL